MNALFVFDWRFILAGCAGTALIIAVSKLDSDGLEKSVVTATEVLAAHYTNHERIAQ